MRAKGIDVRIEGAKDGAIVLGVRPQDLTLGESGIALEVEVIEAMGFEAYVHGRVGGAPFVARLTPEELPSAKVGATIDLVPKRVHAFDRETGAAR
ncbi:MAG: hypothetical protein QM756_20590 [Polyangiaceae bacterium]